MIYRTQLVLVASYLLMTVFFTTEHRTQFHTPVSCANGLISSWTNQWLVTLNAFKTKSMIFSTKRVKPDHRCWY